MQNRHLCFGLLKAARTFALAALYGVVFAAVADNGWSQSKPQLVQRITRTNPAELTRAKPEQEKPINAATAAIDPSSSLGQALAACENMSNTPQESFTLPGLKGEVALDRCYRGRDHLVCVFTALMAEGKSLIDTHTKIVEAKYPELSSVDDICKRSRDSLASDAAGAEDFAKRFTALKSQYESGSRCAASIKGTLRDVVFTALAQSPEILKSMNDTIDGDLGKVSQVEEQLVDLADKMQAALKAIKTVEKIHRAMCVKQSNAPEASGQN